MNSIQRTCWPCGVGESVVQRYHAQNIQATPQEFELMLRDGMTPAERRANIVEGEIVDEDLPQLQKGMDGEK